MRARLLFIIVAILAVSGFAALNWTEILRTTPLSFGWTVAEAPLGLIMLAVLGLTLLVFLLSSAAQESRIMLEAHRHAKVLAAQRDLADKAEASRFTDLRQQLDTHLRDNRQRDAIVATELEKSIVQSQRELRTQLELMNRNLMARFVEFEERMANRPVERVVTARPEVVVADVPAGGR